MRKIIPAVIVTAAAVAAVATYIKKRIDKQNKVNFIEVEIKPKKTGKKTLEKISDAAGTVVSAGKEILIETVDTIGDVVEAFIEDPTDFGEIIDEIKEGVDEIKEIISEAKHGDEEDEENINEVEIEEEETQKEVQDDEDIVEPIEDFFSNAESHIEQENDEEKNEYFQDTEEEIVVESDDTVEKALLINDIVADIITEEERLINEAITQEIEKIIDEVIEEEVTVEPVKEEVFEQDTIEEEISVDEIMKEVALQAQQEHIEEVLSATMDNIPVMPYLAPLDLQQNDDETILKVVDETVGEINLINDIIESLDEDNSVEEAIEDLEDIVETAIYEEPVVDDSLLTEEEFLDRCINLYSGIKENKIGLIIKQVGIMLDTIEVTDTINLQHFAVFASVEDKERYANIAAIEGHHVLHSDRENELIILNTLDSDKISLCKSILQLAQDLTEYNGLYKGWTVS
ncbi:MAG: hypothetical protein ACOX1L_05625 [Erysipelotrichaceae bacterium]|jgi:hypothetical protein